MFSRRRLNDNYRLNGDRLIIESWNIKLARKEENFFIVRPNFRINFCIGILLLLFDLNYILWNKWSRRFLIQLLFIIYW